MGILTSTCSFTPGFRNLFDLSRRLLLVALVLSPAVSLAVGLGNVNGTATLGQPLRVEVALVGALTPETTAECFKLRPPIEEIDREYILRQGQIQLKRDANGARLIVSSVSPIQQPVIQFSINVGCGHELARDYSLLVNVPGIAEAISLPSVPAVPAAATISKQAVAVSAPTVKELPPPSVATVPDTTLLKLSRQLYPLSPRTREKFISMMLDANPELRDRHQVIAPSAELVFPADLPAKQKQQISAPAQAKKPVQDVQTKNPTRANAPRRPASREARGRLTLSPVTEGASAAETERLMAMLADQARTQASIAENLSKLETTFEQLKIYVVSLEQRVQQAEAAKPPPPAKPERGSTDFIELLLAVLFGGTVGAATLHAFLSLMRRRQNRQPVNAWNAFSGAGSSPNFGGVALGGTNGNLPTAEKDPDTVSLPETPARTGQGSNAKHSATQDDIVVVEHDFDFVSPKSKKP